LEAGGAEPADAAGAAGFIGLVTRDGYAMVHTEGGAAADDLCLCQLDEWGMEVKTLTLDARLGSEIGQLLEGLDEGGAAVGVAGVVDSVDANEDVVGADDFGPAKGQGKEDGVPGRNVGDGDAFSGLIRGL
jgi:hypothetical protein